MLAARLLLAMALGLATTDAFVLSTASSRLVASRRGTLPSPSASSSGTGVSLRRRVMVCSGAEFNTAIVFVKPHAVNDKVVTLVRGHLEVG